MPLTNVVTEWRDKQVWQDPIKISEDRSGAQMVTGFDIDGASYSVYLEISESAEQLGIYVYSPVEVPPERYREMCLLLNLLNIRLRLGRLAITRKDEAVPIQWLGLIDVEGSRLTPQQISTLLSAGLNSLSEYNATLTAVAVEGKTAIGALADIDAEKAAQPIHDGDS